MYKLIYMIFDYEQFWNIPNVYSLSHNWWPMGNYPDPNRGVTWYGTGPGQYYPNPVVINYTAGQQVWVSGSPYSIVDIVVDDGLFATANGTTIYTLQYIGYHPPTPFYAHPLDLTPILVPGYNEVFFQMYSGPYAPGGATGSGNDYHNPFYLIIA